MSANDFGLTSETIEKVEDVFKQHLRVEKAVIYGSRAKGNYKNGSDIDLTLFGAALTREELSTMVEELDDLLLPYMIDLSIFSDLSHQGLKEHIERVGKVFYERTRDADKL